MGKILIIGAKGMLGQALVRAFHDAEVFAWDREECDITNEAMVHEKIVALRPTLIINAAAYNDVDGAEKNATLANSINGEAVGYLAQAAASVGATFVHYSTDYVFDGEKREGYRENDIPNPISAYGNSKLLGEQKITTPTLMVGAPPLSGVGADNLQLTTYYLIRTSRLFGKQGNGKKSFVDLMLQKIEVGLHLGSPTSQSIEIVDEEVSSPTYVEDLAQRTREIIEQKKPNGIYHVTNAGACTWYKFAQEIFRQASEIQGAPLYTRVPLVTPVPSSRFPRPAKRPAYSQLLNTKLPPLRSWQDALREYLTDNFSRV